MRNKYTNKCINTDLCFGENGKMRRKISFFAFFSLMIIDNKRHVNMNDIYNQTALTLTFNVL